MTKREYVTAALVAIAANTAVLFAQWLASGWKWRAMCGLLWPEVRYYLQSSILLIPLVPVLASKWRYGKFLLAALLTAALIHAVGYTVKSHIPNSSRHEKIAACDWAVEVIRTDYKGPTVVMEPFFTELEYYCPLRPIIESHTARIPYLLGGISTAVSFGLKGIPDYIVDEPEKALASDWWCVAKYEKLAERRFGRRTIVIYKRIR